MDVVQVVRRLTGLSLRRSKVLTTQVPAVVLAGVPEEDAASRIGPPRCGSPGGSERTAGAGLAENPQAGG
ncbi:hypothetical protein AB0P01_31670 [Streptomyces nigra]